MTRPYRVSMICTGNICRSPMAEVILRQLLQEESIDDVEVTSAGTGNWHVGDGADRRTVQALHEHGYDGSAHIAAHVGPRSFVDHDLLLAADRGHYRALRAMALDAEQATKVRMLREFDDAAVAADTLEVDDPWYGGAEDFERCFTEVEAACRGLVERLRDPATRP